MAIMMMKGSKNMFENDNETIIEPDVESVARPVETIDNIEETNEAVEEVIEEVTEEVAEEVAFKSNDEAASWKPQYNNISNDDENKNSTGNNILKIIGAAALFGIIAGLFFYSVILIGDNVSGKNEEVATETPTIAVSKTETTENPIMVMDVSTVVENAMPSVVAITGTVTQSYSTGFFFGGSYETEAPVSGSGIIIGQNADELLIVTNAHVVEGVNDLTVTFVDNQSASAVVKGTKSNKDIAVVAVDLNSLTAETVRAISIVEIGDSESVKMGQPVIAIGNALGEGQSATVGWISALNRTIEINGATYENLFMTDAAINPGNSGGALFNIDGQLIGINSAKYSDESVEGMGYAIPISNVTDIINNLMNRQVREKVDADKIGFLGISGMDISSSISQGYNMPEGVIIMNITDGSPAQKAGLYKNDIIVGFDDEEIDSYSQLYELLEYYSAGETVKVEYYRIINGEYVLGSVDVTLASRQNNQ